MFQITRYYLDKTGVTKHWAIIWQFYNQYVVVCWERIDVFTRKSNRLLTLCKVVSVRWLFVQSLQWRILQKFAEIRRIYGILNKNMGITLCSLMVEFILIITFYCHTFIFFTLILKWYWKQSITNIAIKKV